MPMNLVIQQKRKELGFTQEQVAEYLNVSIPAVSKWENGSTNPDISLLPPLARLLKTDINTLLCFQEDMTPQEINSFCGEITGIVRAKGIGEGFEAAKRKICEYPHNETLLHYLTFQLDGLLVMSGLPPEEKHPYDDILVTWYRQLAESKDSAISNSANYMLAGKWIREGRYDEAQEVLDLMPDKKDLTSGLADKLMLQVLLYQHQGKAEEASRELQNALLMALNRVQMLLYKMVDAELAAGEMQLAEKIADKASQMPKLFDLWEYNSFVAPLQIAGAKKDPEECIAILRKLLAAMLVPWDMDSSPLFHRIAKAFDLNQMLPAILAELEGDPAYRFLQDCEEFQKLISQYKALTEKWDTP